MLNSESIRFERVIIFSVSNPDEFRAWATEIPYKEGLGHENNREEPIFLAKFDDMFDVMLAGFLEDQDYVIQLDPQEPVSNGRRMAFRLTPENGAIPLGPMTEIGETEALAGTVWSRFPDDTGLVHYYVAKPDNVRQCGWSDKSEEKAEGFAEPTTTHSDWRRVLVDEPTDFDKLPNLNELLGDEPGAAFGEPSDLGAGWNEPAFVEPVERSGCGSRKTAPVDVPAVVRSPSKSCLDIYAPKGEPFDEFEDGAMIGTLGQAEGARVPRVEYPDNGVFGDVKYVPHETDHRVGSAVFGDTTAIPDPHAPMPDFSTLVAPKVLDHDDIDARLARMSLDIDGLRDTVRILETALNAHAPYAMNRARKGGYQSVG